MVIPAFKTILTPYAESFTLVILSINLWKNCDMYEETRGENVLWVTDLTLPARPDKIVFTSAITLSYRSPPPVLWPLALYQIDKQFAGLTPSLPHLISSFWSCSPSPILQFGPSWEWCHLRPPITMGFTSCSNGLGKFQTDSHLLSPSFFSGLSRQEEFGVVWLPK